MSSVHEIYDSPSSYTRIILRSISILPSSWHHLRRSTTIPRSMFRQTEPPSDHHHPPWLASSRRAFHQPLAWSVHVHGHGDRGAFLPSRGGAAHDRDPLKENEQG